MIKSAVKNYARVLAVLAIQMWNETTVSDLAKDFENLLKVIEQSAL